MAKLVLFLTFFVSLFANTCEIDARGLPITAATLKELAHIGLRYTFPTPLPTNLESKSSVSWEGGVKFSADFNQKAKVFRKWIKLSPLRPSNRVIVEYRSPQD